jgi:hypothetical protein
MELKSSTKEKNLKKRKKKMDAYFKKELDRLTEFTKQCRPDMHEPDEQSIYAEFGPNVYKYDFNGVVIRTSFDNACTAEMSYDMGFWLIRREYFKDGSYKEVREWFNLANVVALARMAQ